MTSRRDDLEMFGYTLLRLKQSTPLWIALEGSSHAELNRRYRDQKFALLDDENCELQLYLNYCRGLAFDERPDYELLRRLLRRD